PLLEGGFDPVPPTDQYSEANDSQIIDDGDGSGLAVTSGVGAGLPSRIAIAWEQYKRGLEDRIAAGVRPFSIAPFIVGKQPKPDALVIDIFVQTGLSMNGAEARGLILIPGTNGQRYRDPSIPIEQMDPFDPGYDANGDMIHVSDEDKYNYVHPLNPCFY
ncbi:MAG: hypothetical protein M3Y82_14900, partial [Verrucomicrobiota bacterium]|nr:hypothetical protein [Verrucomicrobiota bacterium]